MLKLTAIQMRRLLVTGAALLVWVTLVLAQGNADEKFSADASSTFAILADQARVGFFGVQSVFENFVKKSHLLKTDGDELLGGSWSIWEGGNASGHITAYAAFPDPVDKKQNHFWVRFDVPAETPMPQALLSHLLAKAQETAVSSGDTLNLRLPSESIGRCTETYTLRIRITSGALVSNTVESSCPVT